KSFAVNPGDTKIRKTKNAAKDHYIILGWEFSGIVIGIGKETEGFKLGDEVYGTGDVSRQGNYAEFVAVDYRIVAHKPKTMKFFEAAAIPLTALTSMGAILDENFRPYSNVKSILIVGGSGGTGSIAIQYLKATTNFKIIATASSKKSREWVRLMGADFVINHLENMEQQLETIGFNQVDQVFSTSHTNHHMSWITKVLCPYGHLSMIESPEALGQIAPYTFAFSIHWQMIFTRILREYHPELQSKFLTQLASLIDNGQIKTTAKTRLSGLTEDTIRHAHTLMESGKHIGKIVIDDL
ncbi:MAG: zinc-binding alcohol dehydrogenase family protein, partial [Flavobacteriaceae bacterium]